VLGFWKGEVCGREGVFIGARRRRNRNKIGWIDSGDRAVSGRENQMEAEGDVGADERVPRVSEKKRGRVYRFGREGKMGRGPFLDPGRNVAGGPFSLLFFFFLFLL
jgi:hypothetical protein